MPYYAAFFPAFFAIFFRNFPRGQLLAENGEEIVSSSSRDGDSEENLDDIDPADRSTEILAVSGPHKKGTRAAELIRLQQVHEEKGLKRSVKTVLN